MLAGTLDAVLLENLTLPSVRLFHLFQSVLRYTKEGGEVPRISFFFNCELSIELLKTYTL